MKAMKRVATVILLAGFLLCLPSCRGLTGRDQIIRLYRKNEAAFSRAAETGDFAPLAEIDGVQRVRTEERCVHILCGGIGAGSGTAYFGIFYAASDDLLAVRVSLGTAEELQPEGEGFLYVSPVRGSNKRYYLEPLGNHFFYYEAYY